MYEKCFHISRHPVACRAINLHNNETNTESLQLLVPKTIKINNDAGIIILC